MSQFVVKRLLLMIPTLLFISLVAFAIIQAPPGDFLNSYVSQLRLSGDLIDQSVIDELRARYGLDQPLVIQYLKWMRGVFVGDFGQSFEWDMPVRDLIGRATAAHHRRLHRQHPVHLPGRRPHRRVLGHAPVRGRGLPVHLFRVPGAGHAQLPAGPGVDVLLLLHVRTVHRRPVLARVRQCRLEPGAGLRHAEAPAGAGDRDRHRPARPSSSG